MSQEVAVIEKANGGEIVLNLAEVESAEFVTRATGKSTPQDKYFAFMTRGGQAIHLPEHVGRPIYERYKHLYVSKESLHVRQPKASSAAAPGRAEGDLVSAGPLGSWPGG
jgi:hypothetical protein